MKKLGSILITGASSGIGKACALHLDRVGFHVFAGVRKDADYETLNKEATDRLKPILLDVTKEETIVDAASRISSEIEFPLFGLINNAGIGISGVLEATPTEELRKLLEVNVLGLHAVTKAFLPLIRKNRGRIINIGSSAGFLAGPGISSYSASKFAVRAISNSLRLELKPSGIFVSLVAPGAIESSIWKKSREYKEKIRRNASSELREAYKLFIAAGDKLVDAIKPIPAIEVAKAVEHALSAKNPKCVYIVGKDARKAYNFSKLPHRILDGLIIKHLKSIVK